MAFPIFNNKLTPEQVSPWSNLLSHSLAKYQALNKAQYAPERERAEIFGTEIGPLAALASNPNFTGFNPEVQKMISQRIGQYLGGKHGAEQATEQGNTPGYANDENIYNRLTQGADVALSPGGKSKVGGSRLAGEVEKIGFPGSATIAKFLGGNEAAGQNAAFEQAKKEAAQKLSMKGYKDAAKLVEQQPGENNRAYSDRIKSLFVNDSTESPIKSLDQKIAQDEEQRADAEATAHAFNTTPEKVLEAQKLGIKTAKEFKEFLEWSRKNG